VSNFAIQTIFSDSVLGVIRSVLLAAVPDQWDWIPATVITIISVVDDIDALDDFSGSEKFNAVVDAVVDALDSADDIPGWSSLPEASRDGLIEGVAEIVVFSMRAAEADGVPGEDARVRFADALRSLTLSILDLVDVFEKQTSVPNALDQVGAKVAAILEG